MKADFSPFRNILLVLLFFGVVLHLIIFFGIKISTSSEHSELGGNPTISFTNSGQNTLDVGMEHSVLMDTAPLYLPTQWNIANVIDSAGSLQEEAELFPLFSAKLLISNDSFSKRHGVGVISRYIQENNQPSPEMDLSAYGRATLDVAEVVATGATLSISEISLGDISPPKLLRLPEQIAVDSPDAFWDPVSFFGQVFAGRLIGNLAMDDSSGDPDWDQTLSIWLSIADFQSGLPDGYYKIVVYP